MAYITVFVALLIFLSEFVQSYDFIDNNRSAAGSNYVKLNLNLTVGVGAPNGQTREMIFVNGTFPGPNLIFDEGDEVEITVFNQMPKNTTIHWHGLEMKNTPWSDGVPGLTQTPIEPGERFVYQFTASTAGTYWYHSHSRMTMIDGLYGSIFARYDVLLALATEKAIFEYSDALADNDLTRPSSQAPAPWHLISNETEDIKAMQRAAADPHLILISDWSRFTSEQYWETIKDTELEIFCVDSILLNGHGEIYCPPTGFLVNQTLPVMQSLMGNATVNDKGCLPFVPAVESIWLPLGHPERIPKHLQEGCVTSSGGVNLTINVDSREQKWINLNWIMASTFKMVQPSVDEHDMWIYEVDGSYVVPRKFQALSLSAGQRISAMVRLDKQPGDYTIRVPETGITQVMSAFGTLRYNNGNPSRSSRPHVQYGSLPAHGNVDIYSPWIPFTDNMPPFPAHDPLPQLADEEFLLSLGRVNSSWSYTMVGREMMPVDWDAYHPFLFYPNDPDSFNEQLVIQNSQRVLDNPNWRYTWLTSFGEPMWMVLRYQVTNPGPWLFHCHFEIHLAGGMGMVILDGVDKWPPVPEEYRTHLDPSRPRGPPLAKNIRTFSWLEALRNKRTGFD
ncbi:multicopper oxidase [Trichophyton equinum CBS 127.97]|uniref:Multicopper oxidase n=1 Tax=Trichophyton equinum (strain ATCC MYA-4606 / CBS 127.97) TaxID=559882 RepID=F2PW07_TRIEC|nr:multicopper oxidase [Trichophyton equinum CBS 127.97]